MTLFSVCIIAFFALSAVEPFRTPIAKLTQSESYLIGFNQGAKEIIPTITEVQKEDQTTKLILGDSVCFRLFSELQPYNQKYKIAPTNRGLTMSGQYILAREYLNSHPKATDIYVILVQDSLITDYETGYGYQYGVMPFLLTDTFGGLDQETYKAMGSVYGKWMLHKSSANFIENSPLGKKLYLSLINKYFPRFSTLEIPDVTERYIEKLFLLCERENVKLHLLPVPHKEMKERRELEKEIIKSYNESKLSNYFPKYFQQIEYYPPERFSDHVHMIGTREELNEVIRTMQKETGELEDLMLEP